MQRDFRVLAAVGSLSLALTVADTAFAETAGGILKVGWFDSPASMSILEESTIAAERPMMGVFNNLVMYDQHVAQNACDRSCRTSPPLGPGTRRGPS